MADLEFSNIYKHFNGVYALQNASFSCDRGEVHALLGENGAGKSTLIKILSGAYTADAGEIKLFGRKLGIRKPTDAMNCGIGTVYQELSTIPDLTVSENIFIGRIPQNKIGYFQKKKLYQMTAELFREYDVHDIDPDAPAYKLSLSKRQTVEIMRVLSKKPDVVILDEATSALTENKVRWLLSLARKLADENRIVIFISHRMAEIQEVCDNITILRNGMTVGEMNVKDVVMDKVISLMLGRKIEGYFPDVVNSVIDEKLLEVRNLTYTQILNSVSFDLYRGEVLGLGGLAGQGQAELLLAVFGIVRPKGEIKLDGEPHKIKTPQESLKKGIALVPEDRGAQGLLMSFPIGYNISLPSLKKMTNGPFLDKKKEKDTVSAYMNSLQIKAESSEMAVMNLSGGNQQKVVLAKMLATKPKLLLMHDITRGVDVGTKKEIFSLVRDLAKEGCGIIYFSTDIEELVNLCDRILVMYDGRIGAVLSGKDMTKENIVSASIGALP
ncbi:MAG: sugar ABC transporter ATP-binding protein [Synergistaceae bacterium]|jgi:ABC-type sugar transport system ATPase subunit|nr:sugar ABC transporter ATP-binding protein [Synergistaceae bacterium]